MALTTRARERQLTKAEEVKALLRYPALYELAAAIPRSGRPTSYPPDLLVAVAAMARVYGSQNAALTELRGGQWSKVCKWYRAAVGTDVSLPNVPPTARVMDRFLTRLTAAGVTQVLQNAFTVTSAKVAVGFGLFADDGEPEYAHPDKRHVLLGDGTFYSPFSEVRREVVDPTAAEPEYWYVNTRAKAGGRPRYQAAATDASQDGKASRGINHVTVSTKVGKRPFVLAVDQAMGAEVRTAVPLLGEVQRVLGRGAHVVVWDRAITGAQIGHLLRDHGLLVINKDVARATTPKDPAPFSDDLAIRLYKAGVLPLGTSVYPTAGGKHDVLPSKFIEFGLAPDTDCEHHLFVDDGALWDTTITTGISGRTKVCQAVPVAAHRVRTGTGWALSTEWRLPCGSHGRVHEFTTRWLPRRTAPTSTRDRALAALRPVPRSMTERFAEIHGDRNTTESLNAWCKARMGTTACRGRAIRLNGEAQLIEHLWACLLRNAITYYRVTKKI